MEIATNRYCGESFEEHLNAVRGEQIRFRAAVAFFTSTEMIERLAESNENQIHLIVSLNPPTSYDAIKRVLWRTNVQIEFVSSGLHSKLYILDTKAGDRFAAIGSSNLTSGGLSGNIETNVLLSGDEVRYSNVESHFNHIRSFAEPLTPEILEAYKVTYEDYKQIRSSKPHTNVIAKPRKLKSPAAKSFLTFWKAVSYVHELVEDLSREQFPDIPVYTAVDYFWHFIAGVTGGNATSAVIEKHGRDEAIRRLFADYATWDNQGEQYWRMLANKTSLVQSLLNKSAIEQLTMPQARDIYAALHSSEMAIQRFGRDNNFANENTIEQVIVTFTALLHSNQRIEFRIDDALTKHKLKHFGPSGVQELNGWYHPSKFPVRNTLAEKALELLQITSAS